MVELAGVGRGERYGKGDPVVLLSNPQADPGWWAPPYVAALTQAGYEVITFVHTGSSFAPQDVIRDVASFVEHLGVGPVRLFGWSQGAAISQEMALSRPDLVAAAALIASYGRQNVFDRLLQSAWSALDGAGGDCDPVRLALLFLTSYPSPLLGDDGFVNPRIEAVREWAIPRAGSYARRRSVEFIAGYQDRLPALAAITVPCLSVGFELDADTFVIRAREVAEAIPGCRYVELPGAGHLAPVTDPELVFEPVLSFFSDIEHT